MDSKEPYTALERLLQHQRDALIAGWREAFERSALRVPRPGVCDQLEPLVRSMLEGLRLALPGPSAQPPGQPRDAAAARDRDPAGPEPDAAGLEPGPGDEDPWSVLQAPGAPGLRELERTVAFAGATMAASGMSGFDVAALFLALRDVFAGRLDRRGVRGLAPLFEWLAALAQDALATARAMAAQERMREQLGQGTPVVLITPRVPAALLVGTPDHQVLDAVFGRLVLLVVRTAAPSAIVDASGLTDPASPAVLTSLRRLAGHDKIAGTADLLAVGLSKEHAGTWQHMAEEAGAVLRPVPRFRDAVTQALRRLDLAIVARPDPAEAGPPGD